MCHLHENKEIHTTQLFLFTSPLLSFCPPHLEQHADGRGHAHHADTHHRHLVPAANRLLLHHMANQLLLGGHLWKVGGGCGWTDKCE